jgi:hypothetical protein
MKSLLPGGSSLIPRLSNGQALLSGFSNRFRCYGDVLG